MTINACIKQSGKERRQNGNEETKAQTGQQKTASIQSAKVAFPLCGSRLVLCLRLSQIMGNKKENEKKNFSSQPRKKK